MNSLSSASSIYIAFCKDGIIENNLGDAEELLLGVLEQYVIPNLSNEEYLQYRASKGMGYNGLGIFRQNDEDFIRLEAQISSRLNDWHSIYLEESAPTEFLMKLRMDYDEFSQGFVMAANTQILQHMNPEDFVSAWLSLETLQERDFLEKIIRRSEALPEIFSKENDFWSGVVEVLEQKIQEEHFIPRRKQLSILVFKISKKL